MDLTGLTPEQIGNINQQDLSQQQLLMQAASALSEDRLRRARGELVPVQVGDVSQSVLREDLPAALDYAAKARTETFQLPSGAKIKIPLDKQPQMLEYLRKNAKLPAEIAALRALEGRQIAQTAKTYAETDKTNLESSDLRTRQAAIKALGGIPMNEWTGAQTASKAAEAFPGVAAALANKVSGGGLGTKGEGLAPNVERQFLDSMSTLSQHMTFNPKKVTDDLINNYNQMSNAVNATTMWSRNEDGDAIQVNLPAIGGKQITPQQIIDTAAKNNISVQELLLKIQRKMEVK